MANYQKGKEGKNATGPKFGTPDHFKGSLFSGGKSNVNLNKNFPKFNPGQFKTQHKG